MTAVQRHSGWPPALHGVAEGWNRIGTQIKFNARSVREMGIALTLYRTEILRLIAQMSLGTGALALIGGTVVVVGFLTLTTGAVIAVQGYNELSGIGVEAMTGFISAYVNVRIISPAVAESDWRPQSVREQPRNWARCASPTRSTHSR